MLSYSKSNKSSNDAEQSLIFFPFAGGCGEYYIPWFKYFDDKIDCYYAMLNGRGRYFDIPAVNNLSELLNKLIPGILKIAEKKPVNLFGHSMGGLIAFELARKLFFEYKITINNLFVSGFRAPSLPYLKNFLHKMNKEELFVHLKDMGGIDLSGNIDLEILKPFLPTLYSDFKLCELYNYENNDPLPCDITVLWGKDDLLVQQEKIKLWEKESLRRIDFNSFSGDHFYMNSNISEIAKVIIGKLN